MKKVLLLLIASVALSTACKKKDVEKTPAEKVAGLWNFNSLVFNEYYSNANHITTTNGISGDYVDFRADGKVYSRMAGQKDTVAYSVVSAATLKVDGLDYEIKALTDNQLVIYNKTVVSSTIYDEGTLNLSR
jgi:hypothetical protein